MDFTNTRNKEALNIECKILNKIALMGVVPVAQAVGVDPSQITRWKRDFIPKIAKLLAAIGWEIEDDQLAEVANRLLEMLTKRKPQNAGTFGA